MTHDRLRELVAPLAAGEAAAWLELLDLLHSEDAAASAPRGFVEAALVALPEPVEWTTLASRLAGQVRSERWSMSTPVVRRFRSWWTTGVVGLLPSDDLGRLALELETLRFDASEGADTVDEVATRIEIASPGSALHVEGLLLLALREREEGRYRDALASAEDAATHAADLEDLGRVDRAARAVAMALLLWRQLDRAFEVLDSALERRGPLFGGGGSFRSRAPGDRLDGVLDEAATIAGWADHDVPEWIRAVGAIAEVGGHAGAARRFRDGLARLAGQAPDRAVSDLEVVVRHASQRGLANTADAAARLLAERFPSHSGAQAIVESWSRARPQQLALAEPDPLVRVQRLFEVFEGFDAHAVAETAAGHQVVDALLALLVERGDLRAVNVARRLYDAKVELHGADVPAAWLELQNVGTVYAQLGRADDARDCLQRALAGLERLAPDAPHTAMARRNLARLGLET